MAAEKGIPIAGAVPQPPLSKSGSVNVEYPKLIIVKATYGLHKEVDVLTQVRKQQSNQGGGLSFPEKAEFNWTFGDPEPGANKALKLWWKYGDDGDVLEQHWYENGGRKAVLLPKDDRPSEKYHGPMHFTAQKVTDLKEWGTKVKTVFVKLEVAGGAVKAVSTKSVDSGASAKEPDFTAAKVPAVTLVFEGQVDAKSTVTVSLMAKGLLLDDVLATATVPLSQLSGDRSERVLELFDDKTRKHLLCKLHYQCTYQGRGGPRALRSAHGAAPPGGAAADPR